MAPPRRLRCVLSLFSFFLFVSSAWSQPAFRYIRLSEPPGASSRALAVSANDSVIVVGGEVAEDSVYHATAWVFDGEGVGRIALPTPDSDLASRVAGVVCSLFDFNTFGTDLVGSWDGGAGGEAKPIHWRVSDTDTIYDVLPTLGGASGVGEAVACGLTILDDLYATLCAGWSRAPAGVKRAVAWLSDGQGGSWTLEPLPDYGVSLESRANVILDPCPCEIWTGVVAGWAENPSGLVYPQVWVREALGGWTRMGLPLPVGAVQAGVNGIEGFDVRGIRAVGWSETAGGIRHATLWTSVDTMQTWTAEDLGALDGYTNSEAQGILGQQGNDLVGEEGDDLVIGSSFAPDAGHTTLWSKLTILVVYDLNDEVVGTQPDLVLRRGRDIAGSMRNGLNLTYVVGWGADMSTAMGAKAPGEPHAYLLTNDLVLTAVQEKSPKYDPALVVAYPNPFGDGTHVSYTLSRSAPVRLSVYDVAGRRVALLVDAFQKEGEHTLAWSGQGVDGTTLTSGVYFIRLECAGRVATRKVVLLR